MKKRETGYDLVRCVAMLFVIAVHTNPKPFAQGTLGMELFLSVFFACNGLFFMLSGRFALSEELNGVREILKFYKRKLFTLLIPFVFFGFLVVLAGSYKDGFPSVGAYFSAAVKGLLGELNSVYLWFMFVLIGLTVSAPFLGKLFRRLSDAELHLLAVIGLICEVLSIWLGKNSGLGFAYSGWFLTGWAFYYFLGYYVYRVWERSPRRKILMISGAAAFVINAIWSYLMPAHSFNAHDLSPLYTVFIAGFYLFLCTRKVNPERVFGKIITRVAQVSYYVYLIHWIIMKLWLNRAEWFHAAWLNYIAHFAVCTVCSVALAFLCHLLWQPVIKKTKH